MTHSPLTGTRRLVQLALRRDRILLPAWLLSISGLTAAVVASITAVYADEADRVAGALFSAANPMTRVFDGPASGTSLGAMAMVEAYKVLAVLVAVMSAQAVVRHTRQDEETGRAELLGSAVVGRHARLAAALLVTFGADVLLGGAVAAVLLAYGLPFAGSLAAAVAVTGVGLVFAGIAAVAAQVLSSARAAVSAAGATLGFAFVLRAVGDVLGEVRPNGVELVSAWPSWLSPIGWGHQLRPFHQDNWEVAGLFVAATVVLVIVAFALTSRRDLGAGMVPERAGRDRAPRELHSAFGLAWRLQRTLLLAWLAGLAVAGAAFGAVGESVDEIVGSNAQMSGLLADQAPGGGLSELYFTLVMALIGVAAGAYTVQALLRLRAEEAAGRLEPVLAGAVSRRAWLGGHVTIAVLGTTTGLVVSGLAGGLVYGAMTGQWTTGLGGLVGAALAQVPAVLALGGLVVALVGLVPRWAPSLAWAALAASLVMGQLGALLELPQPVLDLSPFTHVPRVPAESFSMVPVLGLLAVAAGLGLAGFSAMRRRDLSIGA